jgi:hypothetical protein
MPVLQSRGGAPTFTAGVGTFQFSSQVTSGSLLVCGIRTASGGATPTITDDANGGGSAWTVRVGTVNGGGQDFFGYHLSTAVGASAPTLTVTLPSGNSARLVIAEISTVSAFDLNPTGTTGTGTAFTGPASGTLSQANEIVLGHFSAGVDVTYSQSGSWAIMTGVSTRSCLVWQEVTATTTLTPAVTANTSAAWIGDTYTFTETGSSQDTPELYGRPDGLSGSRQMHQLLAT